MKYISFSYHFSIIQGAYRRLKECFDPAVEGTPYEAKSSYFQPYQARRGLLLKKRVIVRF